MNLFLVHRLRNAAIAADQRRDFAMAELLTETIAELERLNGNSELEEIRERGLL